MNPEVKAKWVAALRSGEYKQGSGALQRLDEPRLYCCLGVLCDLYKKEHPKAEWTTGLGGKVSFCDEALNTSCAYLTPNVCEWADPEEKTYHTDFTVKNPCYNSSELPFKVSDKIHGQFYEKEFCQNERVSLSRLNDIGAPFSIIADVIEKEL